MRVFVDSDVIIASLLSSSGAGYFLISMHSINLFISSVSQKELERVMSRLHINNAKLDELIHSTLLITPLSDSVFDIKKAFGSYVFDIDDAHIVAGAQASDVKFLITYNIKDYHVEKIKKDLHIIVLTPGHFLQYLRSLI